MSDLTPAQSEAMERVYAQQFGERWHKRPVPDLAYKQELVETIFLAGLRYQDEVSDEEVEVVARVLLRFEDWPDRWGWTEYPDDGKARLRHQARAALQAAKGVGGDG